MSVFFHNKKYYFARGEKMYYLTVENSFDSAHFLHGYEGKCSNLHDFYDHAFIVEEGTLKEKTVEALNEENFRLIFVKFRPTAENFSKFFFEEVKKKGYNVSKVCVYETPNNCAAYSE